MGNEQKKKKVALLGLDGCRPDAVLVAKTPNIQGLAAEGYFSWIAKTEFHTVSGPAWTSALTGVHFNKHKVVDNDFKPRDLHYETIFQMIKKWNSKLRTVAHSHWSPIVKELAEPGTLDIMSTGSDKKMATRIAKDIEKDKGDLYFLQLDDIDAAGHQHTYSPTSLGYLKVIEERDQMIGKIMEVIHKRQSVEDWLIILFSDHGGIEKKHGPPVVECLSIVFIIAGSSIPKKGEIQVDVENEEYPEIVDIVPTVAKFLGLPCNLEWDGHVRI